MHKKEYKIGIDIGGTKILGLLVDAEHRIVKEYQYPTVNENGILNWKEALYKTASYLCRQTEAGTIGHMSIACAGLINTKTGTIVYSQSLNVHQLKLADELAAVFTVPVSLFNDADAAAFAEAAFYQEDSLLYISVGTSIGSGLIINGSIFNGAGGMAGEIGHISVELEGRPCPCGKKGCVRAYASGKAMEQDALQWQQEHGQKRLLMPDILSAAEKGDPYYEKLLQDAASRLAQAAAAAVHLLNPSMIVFGGGIIENSPFYFQHTKKSVYAGILPGFSTILDIKESHWWEKSAALGSIYLV